MDKQENITSTCLTGKYPNIIIVTFKKTEPTFRMSNTETNTAIA